MNIPEGAVLLRATGCAGTLIDVVDVHRCSQYNWCCNKQGYVANFYVGSLAHFIIGYPPKGLCVDHINRNKLDNRKCNLRIVTYSVNLINRTLKSGNDRSIYKDKRNGTYFVQITRYGVANRIGTFRCVESARLARDAWLDKHFPTDSNDNS